MNKLIFILPFLLSVSSVVAQEENGLCHTDIVSDLSSRHPAMLTKQMLELSNGEENLVSCLLSLRVASKPPFLGTRAEKLLIQFEDRSDVQAALLSDVSNESRFGLGSIVLSSLPKIKNQALRKSLVAKSTQLKKSTSNTLIAERYAAILQNTPEEYK